MLLCYGSTFSWIFRTRLGWAIWMSSMAYATAIVHTFIRITLLTNTEFGDICLVAGWEVYLLISFLLHLWIFFHHWKCSSLGFCFWFLWLIYFDIFPCLSLLCSLISCMPAYSWLVICLFFCWLFSTFSRFPSILYCVRCTFCFFDIISMFVNIYSNLLISSYCDIVVRVFCDFKFELLLLLFVGFFFLSIGVGWVWDVVGIARASNWFRVGLFCLAFFFAVFPVAYISWVKWL